MRIHGRRMTLHALLGVFTTLSCSVLLLVTTGSAASAAEGHFLLSSFATFGNPENIAVDETTGDLYVLDYENQSIQRFDASGNPVEFAAVGSNVLNGAAGADATPEGAFSFIREGGGEVAIDNSAGPNKGDIYVANMFNDTVDIFSSDGTYLGELTSGSGARWGFTCGVAVDKAGDVYVSTFEQAINKFVPVGSPATNSDFKSAVQGGVGRVCTIAVDGEGSVYGASVFGGPVMKWTAAQFGSAAPSGAVLVESAQGVAVDQANNRVFVDLGTHVAEYDPLGNQVGSFGDGVFSRSVGLGVSGATEKVYVADDERQEVHIFTGIVTMPDISVGAPSNLTETSVTLNASINPDGLDATCKVQYGLDTSYGSEAPCVPADLGAGNQAVAASAALSGLTPTTIYHYRFVTSNPNGFEYGTDHSFASASKPSVDGEATLDVNSTNATVRAQVNPNNFPTTFQVEYGLNSSYGSSSPVPGSNIGANGSDQTVTWTLSGLLPATTYHYRVSATDAFGTVYGPDQTFTTLAVATAGGGSCPNSELRQAQRASSLPNCRAYELVSPAEKGSANIATESTRDQASSDGNAVKYWSAVAFGSVQGTEVPGAEYISRRGSDGWSTHSIDPPQKAPTSQGMTSEYAFMSADLSKGVFYALSPIGAGDPNVARVPNLYLRSDVFAEGLGDYTLLSDSITSLPYAEANVSHRGVALAGASADLAHVAFESSNDLTAEANGLSTSLPKAYEWDDGTLRLAGILPDGEPASASVVGAGAGGGGDEAHFAQQYIDRSAISRDGSRVVFAGPPLSRGVALRHVEGNLYMRIDGTHTIQLNVSERSQPDPNGFQPAEFWAASADDSKVFFITKEMLTDDAPSDENTANLYMYDLDAPEGKRLTLISHDEPLDAANICSCGAERARAVAGVSEDGSYVYFLSGTPLIEGESSRHQELYVWHEGTLRAVAEHETFAGGEGSWGEVYPEWFVNASNLLRVTPDGRDVVFVSELPSVAEAAGREDIASRPEDCPNASQGACPEVYVYDYETNRLTCASCRPAGTPPEGEASFSTFADTGPLDHMTTYLSHPITSDGRYVFFESTDPLVPQASNGRWNVYEYDTATAQVHLISGGTCDCDSHFIDASADGHDVFFTTGQRLVHADGDVNVDLYDARVEGGLASQNQVEAPPCTGSSCQGTAEGAPSFSLPASATFSGVGNLVAPAPKAKPKKAKPKKAKAKKRKGKRKAKGRAGRRARAKRGPAARSGTRHTQAGRSAHRASRRAGR